MPTTPSPFSQAGQTCLTLPTPTYTALTGNIRTLSAPEETVSAVYVGAGSVKQVWPSGTDYGDTYEWFDWKASSTSDRFCTRFYTCLLSDTSSTSYTSIGTYSQGSATSYGESAINSAGGCTVWFPNNNKNIDLGQYSYICLDCSIQSSTSTGRRYAVYPVFSLYDSGNGAGYPLSDTYSAKGSEVETTTNTTSYYGNVWVVVNIKNCNRNDTKLKIGFNYRVTRYSSSTYSWPLFASGTSSTHNITMYKTDSDFNASKFAGSQSYDYDVKTTLTFTYSGT